MLARCTSSLDLHMLIVPLWYLFRTLLVPKVALGRLSLSSSDVHAVKYIMVSWLSSSPRSGVMAVPVNFCILS